MNVCELVGAAVTLLALSEPCLFCSKDECIQLFLFVHTSGTTSRIANLHHCWYEKFFCFSVSFIHSVPRCVITCKNLKVPKIKGAAFHQSNHQLAVLYCSRSGSQLSWAVQLSLALAIATVSLFSSGASGPIASLKSAQLNWALSSIGLSSLNLTGKQTGK